MMGRRRKTTDLALALGYSPGDRLFRATRDAIVLGRSIARQIGIDDLRFRFSEFAWPTTEHAAADIARAEQVARRQVERLTTAAERAAGKTAAERWEAALAQQAHTARSAAATEVFSAATAEREQALRRSPAAAKLLKVWDATLDRRTCDRCASLDGVTVSARDSFPGGLIPGAVHPMCRCGFHVIDASWN